MGTIITPEPGIELDVRVAVEVLDYIWIPYPYDPVKKYLFDGTQLPYGDDHHNIGDNRIVEWSLPRFSEYIKPAWEVLHHLINKKKGIYPEVLIRIHDNKLQHHCDIWYNDPDKGKHGWLCKVYGYTAPHAICLAALETVKHPLWMAGL